MIKLKKLPDETDLCNAESGTWKINSIVRLIINLPRLTMNQQMFDNLENTMDSEMIYYIPGVNLGKQFIPLI